MGNPRLQLNPYGMPTELVLTIFADHLATGPSMPIKNWLSVIDPESDCHQRFIPLLYHRICLLRLRKKASNTILRITKQPNQQCLETTKQYQVCQGLRLLITMALEKAIEITVRLWKHVSKLRMLGHYRDPFSLFFSINCSVSTSIWFLKYFHT